MKPTDQTAQSIYYQLADQFEISAIYTHNDRLIFRARPYRELDLAIATVQKRLKSSGFGQQVKEDDHGLLISVWELPWHKRIPRLNIILFLATLVTVYFSPFFWNNSFDFLTIPGIFGNMTEFTVALMSILLFHEFGHYLAGRRRGVLMSLPYFIPAPNIAGTFGAIIKSRSPFTNRRDLIEVGAAGPIAGFVVAIIALVIGLQSSQVVAIDGNAVTFGDSLIVRFLAWLVLGPLPEGFDYVLTPAAMAGWFGLFVTMINLLPLGQLDGGHILYGLIGRHQHKLGLPMLAVMIALGFWWPGWWIFGALVFLFGIKHPPTGNDAKPLPRSAQILGILALIVFIICFIPVPIKL
ncbi:MAG: site-2 protease family protein [candidate division Zixibacteria bacterium]|nr:site-2 protease family protein [candidate division Zixibacteria bacterium]